MNRRRGRRQLPKLDSPAHQALNAALANATARDLFIPCAGPWDGDSPWLSDDPDERAWAAERCTVCPAISECRQAGQLESWGVWGAIDRDADRRTSLLLLAQRKSVVAQANDEEPDRAKSEEPEQPPWRASAEPKPASSPERPAIGAPRTGETAAQRRPRGSRARAATLPPVPLSIATHED